ncbi:S-methyl-5-thioribose-1-phosphate isomerase [Synchytrium microbalum]|uniref:Translation initiation factor eIF2B subunit delta n=1 Tax=Synchytrium microbalum TaxID=1806994 RepID=A0A507C1A9_9FUNG|nr:S-methyl-5-thioribose-1-phosphate isomerase [Synchytrium microbalum]TPX35300.1 S-methyl-5-thioribose-1-phosphate isomerase [Synchytrium microbalum]
MDSRRSSAASSNLGSSNNVSPKQTIGFQPSSPTQSDLRPGSYPSRNKSTLPGWASDSDQSRRLSDDGSDSLPDIAILPGSPSASSQPTNIGHRPKRPSISSSAITRFGSPPGRGSSFGRSFEENLFRPPDHMSPQRASSLLSQQQPQHPSQLSSPHSSLFGTPLNGSTTDLMPPSIVSKPLSAPATLQNRAGSLGSIDALPPPAPSPSAGYSLLAAGIQASSGGVSGSPSAAAKVAGVVAKEPKKKKDKGASQPDAGGIEGGTSDASHKPQSGKKPLKEMTRAERRELQDRQKAEKAAKAGNPNASTNSKASTPKPQQQRTSNPSTPTTGMPSTLTPTSTQTNLRVPAEMRFDDPKTRSKTGKAQPVHRTLAQKPVSLFSHLTQYERENNILAESKAGGYVHPVVLSLGLQYSEFLVVGGNARCTHMLHAFKKVISDYVTPPGTSLSRNLTSYIGDQVTFLNATRPLAASMKSAIRALKSEITAIPLDMPDHDAKSQLTLWIDSYINEKITTARIAIVSNALPYMKDGDVILTHGRSSVIQDMLIFFWKSGIKFRVIVADSRPKLEGREMLKTLVKENIPCTYILTSAVSLVIKEVTKVLMGASAVLSNGSVMSRAGSALVAMTANDFKIPVLVCCETYKFSDAFRLDSFVWNEIGDPDELVDISSRPRSEYGSLCSDSYVQGKADSSILTDWRDIGQLKLLNLLYDITPAQYVSMLVCDTGCIPSTSAFAILRESMVSQ